MYYFFVSMDIAKDSFSERLVDAQPKPLTSISAPIRTSLRSFSPDLFHIFAGIESIDPYHFNLFASLTEHYSPTTFIHQILICTYAKCLLRLTKTDPKSDQGIALYVYQEHNQISPLFHRPNYPPFGF